MVRKWGCNTVLPKRSAGRKRGGMSADNKEIDYLESCCDITELGMIYYLVPHYKEDEDDIKYNIGPTYLDNKIPYKAESEG